MFFYGSSAVAKNTYISNNKLLKKDSVTSSNQKESEKKNCLTGSKTQKNITIIYIGLKLKFSDIATNLNMSNSELQRKCHHSCFEISGSDALPDI